MDSWCLGLIALQVEKKNTLLSAFSGWRTHVMKQKRTANLADRMQGHLAEVRLQRNFTPWLQAARAAMHADTREADGTAVRVIELRVESLYDQISQQKGAQDDLDWLQGLREKGQLSEDDYMEMAAQAKKILSESIKEPSAEELLQKIEVEKKLLREAEEMLAADDAAAPEAEVDVTHDAEKFEDGSFALRKQKWRQEAVNRVLNVFKNRGVSTAFAAWKANLAEKRRYHNLLQKALARMDRSKGLLMAEVFEVWEQEVHRTKRTNNLCYKIMERMEDHAVQSTFRPWLYAARQQVAHEKAEALRKEHKQTVTDLEEALRADQKRAVSKMKSSHERALNNQKRAVDELSSEFVKTSEAQKTEQARQIAQLQAKLKNELKSTTKGSTVEQARLSP